MANQFLDKTGLAHVFSKIKTLVAGKQDKLTFDDTPTQGSANPVTSGGLYTVLENISGAITPGGGRLWTGTCATAAATAAKVAATRTGDFVLEAGAVALITMNLSNAAASPTLNIDGTGAKPLRYVANTNATSYTWAAGEVIGVIYDGTNYIMLEGGRASTSAYGAVKLNSSVNSTSTSDAATPSAVKLAYDKATTAQTAAAAAQSTADGKQDALTFDATPTAGSTNPVTSGGVYTALQNVSGGECAVPECPVYDNFVLTSRGGVATWVSFEEILSEVSPASL